MIAKHNSFIAGFALAVAACDQSDQEPGRQDPVGLSDRSTDPGTNPTPTNPISFVLLENPDDRRRTLQSQLQSAGKKCGLVTEAILKGGFEGTDFWRVTCNDSGEWLVSFGLGGATRFESCRTSPGDCRAAWESVSG